MKIVFESSPERFAFPFRIIGSAGRYDTISDCEFLDDSRIVCADRQLARLYLIEFSLGEGTHRILDSVECVFGDKPFHFELLYIRDGVVYAVSYRNALFSCEVVDGKFKNQKIVTVRLGECYHGICGSGHGHVYVTNMLRPTITEYNVNTRTSTSIPCSDGIRMKDAAVIDDRCLLALSSDRGPIKGGPGPDGDIVLYNKPYNSHMLIYERHSKKLLSSLTLEKTQVDACICVNGFFFVTCTDEVGGGFLTRCRIDSDHNFIDIVHIPCAGFPHGLAVRDGLFAYTSYAESALYIGRVSADGLLSEL